MFDLTACLMFRDAASYLDEWLRFHLRVGVKHFYLYDNESQDHFWPVIQPFVDEGFVTLRRWPGQAQQAGVILHCLDQCREASHWIAFLDDDEFLFPAADNSLPEALEAYRDYAGVAVSWLLFGSNGHRTRPDGLVTRSYRRRAAWIDRHVKCIVNPAKVRGPAIIAHSFDCLPGEVVVDENFRPMTGPFNEEPSAGVFCLNHYVTKSRQEMVWRRSRVQADRVDNSHSLAEWERFDSDYNAVEDLRIQRFVAELSNDASARPGSGARPR